MQTGQVSIWVPIVVGIIGLVGIVAGQLINTWREDRRWTREQDREDLRWRRESEKEKLAHWRDKKFEIYGELLSFMKRWRDSIQDAATRVSASEPIPEDTKGELNEFNGRYFEHRDLVELIATDRAAQDTIFRALRMYLDFSTKLTMNHFPINLEKTSADAFMDMNAEVIDVVLVAIRVEIGISDDGDKNYLPRIRELEPSKEE